MTKIIRYQCYCFFELFFLEYWDYTVNFVNKENEPAGELFVQQDSIK